MLKESSEIIKSYKTLSHMGLAALPMGGLAALPMGGLAALPFWISAADP